MKKYIFGFLTGIGILFLLGGCAQHEYDLENVIVMTPDNQCFIVKHGDLGKIYFLNPLPESIKVLTNGKCK
jgi:hypothetical protein